VADDPSEAALLSAVRAGDREAFARAVARYGQAVRRFASAFLGDAAEGDDVAQAAFWDLWKARATLRGDGSLRGVLLARARHLCLNRARTRSRVRSQSERLAALPLERPATPLERLVDAASEDEARAIGARIVELVASLDEEARTCIWMRFAGDASFDEIAQVVGRPAHAVRALVYRQLANLRTRLGAAR
jgi:RNA polymerase sigma-70 factor (ECF subfamily)